MSPRALPTRPAVPAWKLILPALGVAALAWWGYGWATRPVNPPVQPAARQGTVAGDWATLKAFGPRTPGTPGHDRTLDWAQAQLTALGYHVTRDAFPVNVWADGGATVTGPDGLNLTGRTLYGSQGSDQQGDLVRVPGDASDAQLEGLDLQMKLVVTSCPTRPWGPFTAALIDQGAFGVAIIDDCARPTALSRAPGTPLPLLVLTREAGAALSRQVGQTVTFTTRTHEEATQAANLVARRVDGQPQVIYGAHLDSVPGAPGANDNASGVLAVLALARRAAGTPDAERAWFALFDAEELGLNGSRQFVRQYAYPMEQTRAMINLDMVGVNAQPLGVAATEDLLPLIRAARPGLREFRDDAQSTRETFGRSLGTTGLSDHASFKAVRIPAAFLHRGVDRHYHTAQDTTLNTGLVQDAAHTAWIIGQAVSAAPFTPRAECGLTGRDCH
ncbi:M28 family metallopeptidase [Deinococcus radiotolerans]|uniref:Aminopeptidase n=1 Tax=Deinococcus radiotolerans TaxID=1309407 RepID=A0ABQ2FF11_9DEIO|nr:M28 family peptidase [Deinococcus radiotolerans]GGK91978.1 aminopeptidase [Deinococcus radiotolerans]